MDTSENMQADVSMAARIDQLETKIDAIYASVEKTRKYYLTSMVITIIFFVLPLIGLVFAIPAFIDTYAQLSDTAGLLQGY